MTNHVENISYTTPSRKEWFLAALVSLISTTILLIPYLLGYWFAQEGTIFSGILMNPEDSQTYFAKMLQGYDGAWLYAIPFTSEPHAGAFVGGFYLGLGHLARIFDVTLTAVWHGARFASSVLMFLATFHFISNFISRPATRWLAYLLAIFGSGLGWLLFLLNQPYWLGAFPVDFKQPGSHLFFTALTFPHVAVGTSLTLLSILWLRQAANGRWRYVMGAGVVHILLGIAYPFLIYLSALNAALYYLYLVIKRRRILWLSGLRTAVAFLIPAPLFLYYAYVLQTNPVFRAWDWQSVTASPPWPHYLVAYGPMLLMAGWLWTKRPSSRSQLAILWIWVLAVALLLYAPLNPQRRFVQGVQVPLAMLTAVAFTDLLLPGLTKGKVWQSLMARPRYSSERLTRFVAVLFVLFMSLSNLYLLASVSISAVREQPDPLFRPQTEVEAAAWLRDNVPRTAVILGAYQTGNYLAAHAGQRVVIGHSFESVDFERKSAEVPRFFQVKTSDDWRLSFLQNYRVDILWYGPREEKLGDWSPENQSYLEELVRLPEISIFQVRLNDSMPTIE